MTIYLLLVLAISPPEKLAAYDKPNDAGGHIYLKWQVSKDDSLIDGYRILRQELPGTTFVNIGSTSNFVACFDDGTVKDGQEYRYLVAAIRNSALCYSAPSNIAKSYPQFFHTGRINILICIVIFILLLGYFLFQAKQGKKLFVRKISGLDAVEEAVGRATEMGRPILYVPGLGDIDWTATIASMNILGEVAKRIVLYDTPLIVTNCWSIVYTVAKEVVKEAFLSQGRPEKFKEDYVRYLTEDQFGFAAAIDGIIIREKPATNFFIGRFWAESLIIAETGAQSGALQIAGTDAVNQLPFFVTSCDYTLLGEELYAASAYLSREPLLLGSLKAQDYGKLCLLLLLLSFTILSFFKLNLLSLLRIE